MVIYKKIGIYGLAFLSVGCSLTKQQEKAELKRQQFVEASLLLKQTSQQEQRSNSKSLFLRMDSAEMAFAVEIWPQGPFNFSPYKGFEGTAQKIIYHGKASQLSNAIVNKEIQQAASLNANTDLKLQKEEKSLDSQSSDVLNVKRDVTWKWWLIAILGIAIFVFAYRVLRLMN